MANRNPNGKTCFIYFRGTPGSKLKEECITIHDCKLGEAKKTAQDMRIKQGKPAKILRSEQSRKQKNQTTSP